MMIFKQKLFKIITIATIVGNVGFLLTSCNESGSNTINLNISNNYNVQIGASIYINVISNDKTLSINDFEFIHKSQDWQYEYNDKNIIITSMTPNDQYGEKLFILCDKYNVKWSTTIHFYNFTSTPFVAEVNTKQNLDGAITGDCQDYETDISTTNSIISSHNSYKMQNIKYNFDYLSFFPRVTRLTSWWNNYGENWKDLLWLGNNNYLNSPSPIELQFHGKANNDTYDPFYTQKTINWANSILQPIDVVSNSAGHNYITPITINGIDYKIAYLFTDLTDHYFTIGSNTYAFSNNTVQLVTPNQTTCTSDLDIDYNFSLNNLNWTNSVPFDIYAYRSDFASTFPFQNKSSSDTNKIRFPDQTGNSYIQQQFYSTGIKFSLNSGYNTFHVDNAELKIEYVDPSITDALGTNIKCKIIYVQGKNSGYYVHLKFDKTLRISLLNKTDGSIIRQKLFNEGTEFVNFMKYNQYEASL